MVAMAKAPITERLAATWYAVNTRFREPKDLRLQRLWLWPVFRQSAGDIPDWVSFPPLPEFAAERYVGLVALNREPLIRLQQENRHSQLGMAQALGNAVLFSAWPPNAMAGLLTPIEETDLLFGVRLPGLRDMHVAPAVLLANRTVATSPDIVAHAGVLPLSGVSPHVRVY